MEISKTNKSSFKIKSQDNLTSLQEKSNNPNFTKLDGTRPQLNPHKNSLFKLKLRILTKEFPQDLVNAGDLNSSPLAINDHVLATFPHYGSEQLI